MPDIFGIDPGGQGGAAWMHNCLLGCVETVSFSKVTRAELLAWFVERGSTDSIAYVEKVSSSPQQGVKSAFTFGMNYERPLMALTAAGVRVVDILPRAWQKEVSLVYPKKSSHTVHKQMGREKAQQLFPDLRVTNAVADALLIARAGCLIEGRSA